MARYIDAESYDQILAQREKALWEVDAIPVADAVSQCRKLLCKQPTIEAEPVVHGRWIRNGNKNECDRCGFFYYSTRADYRRCPKCEAKMDLKGVTNDG